MQEKAMGAKRIDPALFFDHHGTDVSWLGGAGFLILADETVLLIDPCLYTNEDGTTETGHRLFYPQPLQIQDIPDHSHILYTHSDWDHMGLKTACAVNGKIDFYGPKPCCDALLRAGIGENRLHLIRPDETFSIENVTVSTIAADHGWQVLNPEKFGPPFGKDDCVGFDVSAPDARLLFPGDTKLCPHHMKLPDHFDLMALDVSEDPFHMGYENSALLARHLSKARFLPCHFGTYDAPDEIQFNGKLSELKKKMGEDARRVLPSVIGNMIHFEK